MKSYGNHFALARVQLGFKIDVPVDGSPGNLLSARANLIDRRRLTLPPSNQEMLWLVRAVLDP
jgi:hypothetical protein